MKFFCLLPVRDESDIIGQCLTHALNWADAIHVFDTGSVDNTWEIVQDFAARDQRVVPMRKEAVYFSETRLRGYMFHVAREQMREGDWFLRMDADEFHHIAPPEFVKTRMRKHETIAYHQYYDFRLLQSEVDAWNRGNELLQDRAQPIEERRRHYTVSAYAEPRLCRYRRTMQWTQPELHHWAETEWRKFITPDNLPELKHWKPGTEFPLVHQTNHLCAPPVRAVQRLVHAFGLPMLDRKRPAWSADAGPQPIPPEIVKQLEKELKT